MIDENVDRGTVAELEFIEAYKAKYPNAVITKATKEQDINEHWDYECDGVKIDIKARRYHMGVLNINGDYYTFLELVNRNGDTGSLYGKADMIAFEIVRPIIQGFLVVPRTELVQYVKDNMVDEFVTDRNLCEHKKVQVELSILTGVNLETISVFDGTEYIRKV